MANFQYLYSLNAWTISNDIIVPQTTEKQDMLSEDYNNWRKEIISLIEQSKLKAILGVNAELLALYQAKGERLGCKPLAKLEQLPIRKASLAELPCRNSGTDLSSGLNL